MSESTLPAVTPVTPGQGTLQEAPDTRLRDVTPGVSSLVSRLLQRILPLTAQAVRDRVERDDRFGALEDTRSGLVSWELLQEDLGIEVLDGYYANALAEYALKHYDQRDLKTEDFANEQTRQFHQDWKQQLESDLTTIGSGGSVGPYNSGLENLTAGPLKLHEQLEATNIAIRVHLDAQAWEDVEDPRTAQRTLQALVTVAETFDIQLVLSSPRLIQALEDHCGNVLEDVLDLAGEAIASRHSPTPSSPEHEADDGSSQAARDALATYDDGDGHLKLLKHIPADEHHQQRTLYDDPDIGLAESTVDGYVRDLEEQGLLKVDRNSGRYNRLTLTESGRDARDLIGDDYSLRHPEQATLTGLLSAPYSNPSQPGRYSVTRALDPGGGDWPPSPEAALAATGSPDVDADYVQWLSGADSVLDRYGMHKRLTAGIRGDGVTLVDDPIKEFEDGRVSYISAIDDTVLNIVQWGGPLPTMGRIAASLLSPRLLSKVLDPERVGGEFQKLHDRALLDLEESVHDIVRWGHQVGWFSEDEEEWEGFKERYLELLWFLLEELGEVANSDDVPRRTRLFEDLHGVITSICQLYYAAGLEVKINVRVPNTRMLSRDEKRLCDFLDFLRYTVTKQTVYKYHSGFRMILEDREEKLKKRLPYSEDIDEAAPYMETTADFLLSGPNMTGLLEGVQEAIAAEDDRVRDDVQEGTETAAAMGIPVQDGNTYIAGREVLEELTEQKGYQLLDEETAGETDQTREQLMRLLLRALADADQPHRLNPHDIAEVLLRISSSSRAWDPLSIADLEYGLSQLAPERVLPELPVTATKMVQELLAADDPVGRSELIERAGISGSSYDRHITELSAMAILEPRQVEGRRRWTATLTPWWSPDNDDDAKENSARDWEDADLQQAYDPHHPEDIIWTLALRFAKLFEEDTLLKAWMELEGPLTQEDIHELCVVSRRFERWSHFVTLAWPLKEDLAIRDEGLREEIVMIGTLPGEVATEQTQLGDDQASSEETVDRTELESPDVAV